MPSADQADLHALATYDFSDRNEEDIRAEWIETLLRSLGYGLGTRHRVRRDLPLALRPPLRMIGSSGIEPDFIPTVFGRRLWIIEAKRPVEDLFSEKHLGQAWSYATDPRIDVPFMVLCDGQQVGVFDVTREDWDVPICKIDHSEIAEQFNSLFEVVGAPRIAETIRVRQLRHLRQALEAQLDLEALDRSVEDVKQIVADVRPVVVARREEIREEARREVEARGEAARDAVGLWGHAQHLNGPIGVFWRDIDKAVELVRRQEPTNRAREFDYFEVATTPAGDSQARMWFGLRAIRLSTAAQLIEDEGCGERCREAAMKAAVDHESGFADDLISAAAYRLQRLLGPFGYRFAAAIGSKLDEQVEAIANKLEIEEWLRRDGELGLTAEDAYQRVALLAPRVVLAQISPWTPESLSEIADGIENLIPKLPTPARYRQLQPAGDPWRQSWIDGDPLRDLSVSVLEPLLADAYPAAVAEYADELRARF